MSVVTSTTRYTTRRAAPDDAPPPDVYQFKLVKILDYTVGEYKGKINEQFKLEFEMLDWENKDGNPYLINAYYSPKIHYVPPKDGKATYREPDLYLMLKAINGGQPLPLDHLMDEDGELDYGPEDVEDILESYVASGTGVFRAATTSTPEGWARIKKDSALPLKPARPRASARVLPPPVVEEADDIDEEFE